MIEMVVRTVRRCSRTGNIVAILEPRGSFEVTELELPICRREAHLLLHELNGQPTMRGQVLGLVPGLLAALDGTLGAVEIAADDDGNEVASLRVDGPNGSQLVPVGVAHALGVAVCLRVPVLVSECLISGPADPTAIDDVETEIPAAFRRAFSD